MWTEILYFLQLSDDVFTSTLSREGLEGHVGGIARPLGKVEEVGHCSRGTASVNAEELRSRLTLWAPPVGHSLKGTKPHW